MSLNADIFRNGNLLVLVLAAKSLPKLESLKVLPEDILTFTQIGNGGELQNWGATGKAFFWNMGHRWSDMLGKVYSSYLKVVVEQVKEKR